MSFLAPIAKLRSALAVTLMVTAVASAQRTRGGGGAGEHASNQIPFPALDRVIKFPVARLSKAHFNEMGAIWSILPKGYVGKVKKDQQVILLNYGYKQGGIVRVFETAAVPGITPEALARQINDDEFFHNVKRGDWKVRGLVIHGVYVIPTSDTTAAFTAALADFGAK